MSDGSLISIYKVISDLWRSRKNRRNKEFANKIRPAVEMMEVSINDFLGTYQNLYKALEIIHREISTGGNKRALCAEKVRELLSDIKRTRNERRSSRRLLYEQTKWRSFNIDAREFLVLMDFTDDERELVKELYLKIIEFFHNEDENKGYWHELHRFIRSVNRFTTMIEKGTVKEKDTALRDIESTIAHIERYETKRMEQWGAIARDFAALKDKLTT